MAPDITTGFKKLVRNQCTPQEVDEVMDMINDDHYATMYAALIAEELAEPVADHEITEDLRHRLDLRLKQILESENKEHEVVVQGLVTKRLWPRIAVAAAAVAAITLGVWLYYTPGLFGGRHPELVSGSPLANDIAPGKNTATIKIGDGEAITLSDQQTGVIVGAGSLKYDDNTPVISNEERNLLNSTNKRSLPYGRDDVGGKPVTVTTPRGGTYQVTLPDGTKVWLNAASVLTYTMPLNERGGIRKVQLSGEAYFEVFRNKKQPFVVTTKNLTTTVLGTHFNISAYEDEKLAKATLLEGSVRVNRRPALRKGADEGVVLQPNQQATASNNAGLKVSDANLEETMAWKNGYFRFNDEKIESIMSRLARWYDIEVVYEGKMSTEGFTGTASRNKNISQILTLLENTKGIHFKIEGRRVTVIQ